MEQLKALAEVCQPDVRYRNRVDLDLTTGAVSETTIQSLYSLIEPIRLAEKVQEEVRNHFEIARNLALYSWFVYPFNVVAAMHAYSTLEMALKQNMGKKRISLKKSLAKAFNGRQLAGGLGPPVDLPEAIAYLRNDLAHGNSTLHGQGIDALKLCAELINELFA
jgi:hypothetical protein